MSEQQAEALILRWCRKSHDNGRGSGAIWCMRVRRDGTKIVIDNSRFDSPVRAQGATWAEVYAALCQSILSEAGLVPESTEVAP